MSKKKVEYTNVTLPVKARDMILKKLERYIGKSKGKVNKGQAWLKLAKELKLKDDK